MNMKSIKRNSDINNLHQKSLLSVENLSVVYPTTYGNVQALQKCTFDLYSGKTLVILGESGCGKSTLGRALLGLLPPPGVVTEGSIYISDQGKSNLTEIPESEWQHLRGKEIGLILQDPIEALNPVLTIGMQMVEALQAHNRISFKEARSKSISLLEQMGLSDPERIFRSYPFQLSGGMCQRVSIAIALSNNSRILIADEPTTALDVRVQASILSLIKRLQKKFGITLFLITHDVGVAAEVADYIAVMYAGRIVEIGPADKVLYQPKHPYTKALFDCFPRDDGRLPKPLRGQPPSLINLKNVCSFVPRCIRADNVCRESEFPPYIQNYSDKNGRSNIHKVSCYHPLGKNHLPEYNSHLHNGGVRIGVSSFSEKENQKVLKEETPLLKINNLTKIFYSKGLFTRHASVFALNDVSFEINKGEVVGLVGESGCGKTTLARCVLRLEEPSGGKIFFKGIDLSLVKRENLRQLRRFMQPIFQDPRGSLNIRKTAIELAREPLDYFRIGSYRERTDRARHLLNLVGLQGDLMNRRPNHLSTGQCQRVAIARALVIEPDLLICDEPISSLDLSVQAQILELLAELQNRLGFGMLFISHNILVVQSISKHVIVMQDGKVCEILPANRMQEKARHPYTHLLLKAIPRLKLNQGR